MLSLFSVWPPARRRQCRATERPIRAVMPGPGSSGTDLIRQMEMRSRLTERRAAGEHRSARPSARGHSKKYRQVQQQRADREERQQYEPNSIASGRLLQDAEHNRREEAAEAADGAHQPGDRAHFSWEVFRHQAEDRAAAETEGGGNAQGSHREYRHARGDEQQRQCGDQREDCYQRRAPPMRSANQPPTGRSRTATTTKPAVRKPASSAVRPNRFLSRVGR